jgi:hypothetical protein
MLKIGPLEQRFPTTDISWCRGKSTVQVELSKLSTNMVQDIFTSGNIQLDREYEFFMGHKLQKQQSTLSNHAGECWHKYIILISCRTLHSRCFSLGGKEDSGCLTAGPKTQKLGTTGSKRTK